MSDELVKRLRSKTIVHTDAAVWMVEAADRIEELEAKLTEAKEALVDMTELFSADGVLRKGTHLHATLKGARIAIAKIKGEQL